MLRTPWGLHGCEHTHTTAKLLRRVYYYKRYSMKKQEGIADLLLNINYVVDVVKRANLLD